MRKPICISHESLGASPEWRSLLLNGTRGQYAATAYLTNCECIQPAQNKQSLCDGIRRQTSSRIGASSLEGQALTRNGSEDYLRTGSSPVRYERMAEGTQIAVAGIKPGLASSLPRRPLCDPGATSLRAPALSGLGIPFRPASFCSHEFRSACIGASTQRTSFLSVPSVTAMEYPK